MYAAVLYREKFSLPSTKLSQNHVLLPVRELFLLLLGAEACRLIAVWVPGKRQLAVQWTLGLCADSVPGG